ncbi:unnamed protein product [Vicia faba]|uniref:Condensin complex subunit 2 n=1 Tax=Vicia faba TaxID=3906 RepID=A0AAV0Z2T7_VICFA|nr:unnamed protein product [Vicia faba]
MPERAAAHAAANRRTSRSDSNPCLNKNQILELFHRCIKLASENVMLIIHQSPPRSSSTFDFFSYRSMFLFFFFYFCAHKINHKNTWELDLIDHLTDIIRDQDDNHIQTDFQMAGCILEAGVKIYSSRVDSLYSETYKVLARMNRAGQESEQESVNAEGGQEDSKKGIVKKLSPLSTLESSFEALNVKKFDGDLKSHAICYMLLILE